MEKENKNLNNQQKNKDIKKQVKNIADQNTYNAQNDDVVEEFDEENEIGKNLGNSFNKLLGCG